MSRKGMVSLEAGAFSHEKRSSYRQTKPLSLPYHLFHDVLATTSTTTLDVLSRTYHMAAHAGDDDQRNGPLEG